MVDYIKRFILPEQLLQYIFKIDIMRKFIYPEYRLDAFHLPLVKLVYLLYFFIYVRYHQQCIE